MEPENKVVDTPTCVAPVAAKDRLISMDVLRGFALLGILIMNIQAFAMIFSAYLNPTVYGDLNGINYWTRWFSVVFADQKFITIFSMLFGASIILIVEKAQARGASAASLHYRRMAWLALFGLAHALLIWAGDILFFYAISGMVVFLFRNWQARNLFILSFVLLLLFSGYMLLGGAMIAKFPAEDLAKIMEFWAPSAELIAEQNAGNRAGWLGQWDIRSSMYMDMLVNFPMMLIRMVATMLIGLGLYKACVLDASRSNKFYLTGMVIGLGIGLPTTMFGLSTIEASGFDMAYSIFHGGLFGFWASFFTAFGYICMVQWICRSSENSFFVRWMAPVGQMALSNYIFQSILCGTIFFGWGFGLFGSVERGVQMAVVIAVWAIQIALSGWWLNRYRFGPLEWAWRSLTYWQRQPMVRD
jgi:uncharacterized protein